MIKKLRFKFKTWIHSGPLCCWYGPIMTTLFDRAGMQAWDTFGWSTSVSHTEASVQSRSQTAHVLSCAVGVRLGMTAAWTVHLQLLQDIWSCLVVQQNSYSWFQSSHICMGLMSLQLKITQTHGWPSAKLAVLEVTGLVQNEGESTCWDAAW